MPRKNDSALGAGEGGVADTCDRILPFWLWAGFRLSEYAAPDGVEKVVDGGFYRYVTPTVLDYKRRTAEIVPRCWKWSR
jgi:hypothetical protein